MISRNSKVKAALKVKHYSVRIENLRSGLYVVQLIVWSIVCQNRYNTIIEAGIYTSVENLENHFKMRTFQWPPREGPQCSIKPISCKYFKSRFIVAIDIPSFAAIALVVLVSFLVSFSAIPIDNKSRISLCLSVIFLVSFLVSSTGFINLPVLSSILAPCWIA